MLCSPEFHNFYPVLLSPISISVTKCIDYVIATSIHQFVKRFATILIAFFVTHIVIVVAFKRLAWFFIVEVATRPWLLLLLLLAQSRDTVIWRRHCHIPKKLPFHAKTQTEMSYASLSWNFLTTWHLKTQLLSPPCLEIPSSHLDMRATFWLVNDWWRSTNQHMHIGHVKHRPNKVAHAP